MNFQFATGSIWRKWDLHFHTQSSFDYENSSITDQQIIDSLISAGIEVVAITDHHRIDTGRIKNLTKLAGEHIFILPGIELRSDHGSKPIHYIGIFPNLNLDHIWGTIQGALGLTQESIREKGGDERVYVPIEEAHEVFARLGGVISIHAGAKSNSIENIKNTEQFQQRIKFDITKKYVDVLEIGQLKDIDRYLNIVFPNIGFEIPLIIGSDNHNAEDYRFEIPCWIKADRSFFGLRQIKIEPSERVFLGDTPEIFNHVGQNRTKYIKSLSLNKRKESDLNETWFDGVKIDFNTGLIAIIGNKGNGKSAFSDVIGMLGNSSNEESFSFLRETQFRHPRGNKASHFDATLTWQSGDIVRKNLNDHYNSTCIESVKYIPQFHLDKICEELKGGEEGRFNNELKQVIYSRIPDEERLGRLSLDDLIDYRTSESQSRIRHIKNELARITSQVIKLETLLTHEYKKIQESELDAIEKEIDDHIKNKPKTVKQPESDPQQKSKSTEINKNIEELTENIKKLDTLIRTKNKELEETILKLHLCEKLNQKVRLLAYQVENFYKDASSDCRNLGLDIKTIVEFKTNLSGISSLTHSLASKKEDLNKMLEEDVSDSLVYQRNTLKKEINKLREKLDRPNKEYQRYLAAKSAWEQKLNSLVGDSRNPKTQKYYQALLSEIGKCPEKLQSARKQQLECAHKIFDEKLALLKSYEELYAPIQEFIDNHPIARDRFGLEFNVSLVPYNFVYDFLEFINQQRRGSFHGEIEGKNKLNRIVLSSNFDSKSSLNDFIEKILNHLLYDNRNPKKLAVTLKDQLRDKYTATEFYEFLYGLEYLDPRYDLRWEGKTLEQLSPGERGTLLLIFYLLIDNSMIPLIIDQPEGNLDNQTVYQLLVDCIKEAKRHRQIFIVTHNPNIAVVCDSEQVIYSALDKENNYKLSYLSGSLENKDICTRIVDVLEGTKPAIENRIAKYKIIFDS